MFAAPLRLDRFDVKGEGLAINSARLGSPHVGGRRRKLVLLVLGSKLLCVAVVVLAYAYLPFCVRFYEGNFVYPPGEPIHLASAFKTWDAHHYLWLSEAWYVPGSFSNNYYPLFPALIGLVNRLVGNAFISGLLVSNLLSLAAFYAFYRFVEDAHGPSVAAGALTLLIAFPTAFYFSLIYRESLFLLLAVSFFLFLSRGAYARSWLCAFLLPLTRPLGIAILVPFLVERVVAARRGRSDGDGVSANDARAARMPTACSTVALSLAPLIGFVAYLTIMWLATSHPSKESPRSEDPSAGGVCATSSIPNAFSATSSRSRHTS